MYRIISKAGYNTSRLINRIEGIISAMLLLLILSTTAHAQHFAISDADTRHLTTYNGLSDLMVNEIYRDRTGYIYLGNGGGIDRFDGVRIRSFVVPGTNERLKRINTITEDNNGTIYAGNGEGLFRLDISKKELERVDEKILNFPINDITAIGDTLYMATDRCLFLKSLSSGELKNVHTDHSSFAELSKISGLCAADDTVWLTGKGVIHHYSMKDGKIHIIHAPAPYDKTDFGKCISLNGKLYIATNVGVVLQYNPQANAFATFAQFGRNAITSIGAYETDKIYIATDGNGLYIVDSLSGDTLQHYSHNKTSSPQLSSNSIYAALIDDKGILWVGYYQGGADYTLYHHNTFEVYSDDLIDTNGMAVRSFAKDGDIMLIGTREGLHFIDRKRRLSKLYTPDVLKAEMIFAICRYNNEYLKFLI